MMKQKIRLCQDMQGRLFSFSIHALEARAAASNAEPEDPGA